MFTQYTKFLTEEQRQMVHEASMEVLENTGMLVKAEVARDIFKEHGCTVQDDGIVKIPHEVIEKYIKMFPSSYTFTAQDPQYDITIPEQGPCVVTASSAPFIIDPVTKQQRRATSDDIANIARLINQLPGFNVFSISTLADDAPDGDMSLYRFYAALKNCKKPVRSNTPRFSELKQVLELGYTIAGGEEAYMERPFINHHYCPVIDPLEMEVESTETVTYLAKKGLPVYTTTPVSNAGMTVPMSRMGSLIVGNAEFLAINVYYQMCKEGTPIIYAYLPTVADLRTGAYTPGAIETGTMAMAHAEMAAFYNVPCGGYIGLTNSHCNDAQNGYEVAFNTTGAVCAGCSLLNMGGLLDSLTTFDFAKAVIDNEVAMSLKSMKKGVPYSEADYKECMELIDKIGPGGLYMEEMHTMMNMKDIAYLTNLGSRDFRTQWDGRDLEARCWDYLDKTMAGQNPVAFCTELDQKIHDQFPGLCKGDAVWPR
ncbi:MAG: trimethylamine methyltransferase family protein [Firmicutes bacterium]|nr:trimethylamine methyltransferase family protein [Bacillota bacterium]